MVIRKQRKKPGEIISSDNSQDNYFEIKIIADDN